MRDTTTVVRSRGPGHGLLGGRPGAAAVTCLLTSLGVSAGTWPLIANLATHTLRRGDAWLSAWQLNWYHHALLTDPLGWADANIFFPYQNVAGINDLLWTHALVALPAAWAGSPVLAHNAAWLLGVVLCGFTAWLLTDELTGSPWAAAVAGVAFALTPYRFLHDGHLSVAAAWSVPLFCWALLRHFREPSWRRAAALALAGLALCTSSLYLAAFLAPLLPLIIWFAARRGPGGREVWVPAAVTGAAGLVPLTLLLVPFVVAMRSFRLTMPEHDLVRHAADLSSLSRLPRHLRPPGSPAEIHPEAHLYAGAALIGLALVGVILAFRQAAGGRGRTITIGLAVAAALVTGGSVLPLRGLAYDAWRLVVVLTIWVGPLLVAAWAVASTRRGGAVGPDVALRLGVAGAALSFVLALGPEAHHAGDYLGPAPYALLSRATQVYEVTRAPARFGGFLVLFLALVGAAVLARWSGPARRRLAVGLAVVVVVTVFAELPRGNRLAPLPDLDDPTYDWLAEQTGEFGILELPEHRPGWGSARYMLASKRHAKHLVNGAGRITPGLWRRFLRLEPFSREYFEFIASYFPVRYVVLHADGLPARRRPTIVSRLAAGAHGWRQVHRAGPTRVFTIDRSTGAGSRVDRLHLRAELAPAATVFFSARIRPSADGPILLDFFQNAELVTSVEIGSDWSTHAIDVPVAPEGPLVKDVWPRSTTRFTWQARADERSAFELRGITVVRAPAATAGGGSAGSTRGLGLSPHASLQRDSPRGPLQGSEDGLRVAQRRQPRVTSTQASAAPLYR